MELKGGVAFSIIKENSIDKILSNPIRVEILFILFILDSLGEKVNKRSLWLSFISFNEISYKNFLANLDVLRNIGLVNFNTEEKNQIIVSIDKKEFNKFSNSLNILLGLFKDVSKLSKKSSLISLKKFQQY
jgi:hypothetical protein